MEGLQELLEEFVKPFERMNANGIEIIPNGKKELRGLSHGEVFSFINDVLQVRACKIRDDVIKRSADDFEEAFIDIMISNYRLGCAEYDRNISYNNEHYHYKAENKMMSYLQDNRPELWRKILKKVSEIK